MRAPWARSLVSGVVGGVLGGFMLRALQEPWGEQPMLVWWLAFSFLEGLLFGAFLTLAAQSLGRMWQRRRARRVGLT